MFYNYFCSFRVLILTILLLIVAASSLYAGNETSERKVITVVTLTNFRMVASSVIEGYLRSKGLYNSVDVTYVDVVSGEEVVEKIANGLKADIVFSSDESKVDSISRYAPIYNKSIYSYGHIALITDKGKTMRDLLSCNFNTLVMPDSKISTYGVPASKFLTDNRINCPKSKIILVNSTVKAGTFYGREYVDFVITATSVATEFAKLQKSGDNTYRKLSVLDMTQQVRVSPGSVPRYMAILNKDYLDFVDFIHVDLEAHAVLHSYGFWSSQ